MSGNILGYKLKNYSSIVLFLIIAYNGHASHILGGELTYEYVESDGSSNKYNIALSYFSLCDDEYDSEHGIVIRSNLDNIYLIASLDSLYEKPIQDYPCLNNPEQCFVELVYTTDVWLPIENLSYHILAITCCRSQLSNTINDLSLGSIFHTELKPLAQTSNNSNPRVNTELPAFVCVGEPVSFFIGGDDPDGDQLVYELCTPNLFDASIVPAIPPLPPYSLSPYILPDYSSQQPLGQGAIELNANTGELQINANISGSFLVGFCIKEYRNGLQIGTTKRDFVLNVSPCTPLVSAVIESDEIVNHNEFIINKCNGIELTIENISTDTNHIQNHYWNINNTIYTDWSPTIQFDEFGTYNGKLILNPNDQCSDTAIVTINLSSLSSDFQFSYDTCVSGPVWFDNNSISFGGNEMLYQWDFGDSTISEETAPLKYFQTPGQFNVSLIGTNEFGCTDSTSNLVDWRPVPAIIIVSPDTAANCAPLSTTFNNLSWPIDSTYDFVWDFGDNSGTSNNMNPSHEYMNEGLYDVSVSIKSPIGCTADSVFQGLIAVEAPPIADFSYSPQLLTQNNNEVNLSDFSERAAQWRWFFDDTDSIWMQEPTYVFADTGFHTIQLIVSDIYGCVDTMVQFVDVAPNVTYFLPNAFSPNGDGVNDLFAGKGSVDSMLNFELQIFDRWGNVLFSTSDPNFTWDGISFDGREIVPNGVYLYQYSYMGARGIKHQDNGFLTLLR